MGWHPPLRILTNQTARENNQHEQLRHPERPCRHPRPRRPPTRTITAGGVTYAYRELGPKAGIPVVFFVHLAATLDNWDPRIIDPIAKNRHVITFDQRGVGASTGQVPDSIEAMADDALYLHQGPRVRQDRHLLFSMGGIAQDLLLKPDLVRKVVLAGTGPRGRRGHE